MKGDLALKSILKKHLGTGGFEVYLFGSRATGKHKKNSDFDVAVMGKKLSSICRSKIEDDLMRSKFPYKVDIVDMNKTTVSFNDLVMKEAIRWW